MGRYLRFFGIGVAVLVALFVILFLSYNLPATTKAYITGTEVKRLDASSEDGSERTRDVRFVVAKELDSGKTMVFRNEDTGWGWPPYFKFNSGDLMGEAVNFHESDEKEVVLVTYYGWRLTFMDMYPNVVSLRAVDADYQHIPVFKIVFIALLALGVGFVAYRIRRVLVRRRARS